MPLNRCGSASARLSVCRSAFSLAAKSSRRASRTSSPPGSMAASAASPSTRWIEARRFVPASVSTRVSSWNSNAASDMRPGGFAPLASQRRRPAIIRCSTRNSLPSSSTTIRLPIRRRPKTFFPSAEAMGGLTLRSTKGFKTRRRVSVRPARRFRRCSIYTTTSGSSGTARALHNFTCGTNPAYGRLQDSFPGEHPRNRRKGRVMETQDRNADKRRGFFKRAAIATLIGGIAAGIGFKAFAQGGGCGWHRCGYAAGPLDPAAVDQHLDRALKHLYVEIDATDEQKQRLEPIVKQAVRDLLPAREKAHAARKQAVELLAADTIDRGAIEALRAEQIQLAEQASKRFTQALADVAEVLTPAQRKQIAERMESFGRRWRHG